MPSRHTPAATGAWGTAETRGGGAPGPGMREAGKGPRSPPASVRRALTEPQQTPAKGGGRLWAQEISAAPRRVPLSALGASVGPPPDLRRLFLGAGLLLPLSLHLSLCPGARVSLRGRKQPERNRESAGCRLRGHRCRTRGGGTRAASGNAPLPSGRRRTRRGGAPREGAGARADGRLPGPMGAAAAARPPRRAPSSRPRTPPGSPFLGCRAKLRRCTVAAAWSSLSPRRVAGRSAAPPPRPSAPPGRPASFPARSRAPGRLRPQVCGCVSGRGRSEGTQGREASAAGRGVSGGQAGCAPPRGVPPNAPRPPGARGPPRRAVGGVRRGPRGVWGRPGWGRGARTSARTAGPGAAGRE